MRRRSILLVIPSLQGGGAERVVVTLLRHIDLNQFKVILAVVDFSDAVFESWLPRDIEIVDLKANRIRKAIHKIIGLVWRIKPDVLFSTLSHLNLAIAIFKPLLPRNVLCIARESVVVSSLPLSYSLPFWWFWAYRNFYNRFDIVICQSIDMQQDLIQVFGVRESKTVVINNPVDSSLIQNSANERIFNFPSINLNNNNVFKLVAAGRLVHQKGFDLLIKAISILDNKSIHLSILGEGPLRKNLETLAISYGVSDQVSFLGFQRNPYPFFKLADVFVLSSRFEGFPNVVLEALACGTPVIATPAPGGVREIIDELEGCTITEEISANALATALNDFTVGYRVPAATVSNYSVDSIVRRYEQVFSSQS